MNVTKTKSLWALLRLLPCLLLAALVLSLSWSNREPVLRLTGNALKWRSPSILTEALEQTLTDELVEKYDYIELNGWMNKALGINTLNDRQKLANGYLASIAAYEIDSLITEQVPRLAQFLEESGIDFFCASMPTKEFSHSAAVAPGYENRGPENYSVLPKALAETGVPYLDLDGWFRETGWTMEDTYFRTDHHWLPEAAFAATGQIMKELSQRYDVSYEESSLSLENWNVETLPDWFLGSEGKRTGASYAGLDELTYIYPQNTDGLRVSRINAEGRLSPTRTDTMYEVKYLTAPSGYEWNSYCLYLGGDYPLAHVRNPQAPNDRKLLVLGDSYRLPVECFLSSQFREVYHLDRRYYTDGTQAEYIRQIQPDLVLLLFCIPGNGMIHDYGLEAWQQNYGGKAPGAVTYQAAEVSLPEAQSDGASALLTEGVAPGAYELILEQASMTVTEAGEETYPGTHVMLALQNRDTGEISACRYFLTEEEVPQKWIFTVPEGTFDLVAYPGTRLQTAGSSALLQGLTLRIYE